MQRAAVAVLTTQPALQLQQQHRGMATLKDISVRIRSVTNIQKITKSMKMVSAAKYARAERELKPAKPYGLGTQAFLDKLELTDQEKKPQHLMVVLTSDRGLCGAIHSNIGRQVKADLAHKPEKQNVKLICVGDKAKQILRRVAGENILFSINEYGKVPPTFNDASRLSQAILDCGFKYDQGDIYFNKFRTVVSYTTTRWPIFSPTSIQESEKLLTFDSLDEEVLRSYMEFHMVAQIYYALKEAACSEQSSRMTAMEGASKNAGEMIDKLTLQFNRTRQSVITKELIEIISGAAAV